MNWSERSYSGNLFRPRPEILFDQKGQILVVATPWGPRSTAKRAIQLIQNHILSSLQDNEATSPFGRLDCLIPIANDVRIAIQLVNESIFNEENKNEFISGIELFVLVKTKNIVSWAQVGTPSLFLIHPTMGPQPLGPNQDLSYEYSQHTDQATTSPLPSKLLGIYEQCDFTVESMHVDATQNLILLSRSNIPFSKLPAHEAPYLLDAWAKSLSQDSPETPFWIGQLTTK